MDIPLNEGVNSLGFHLEGKVKEGEAKGKYSWVGFTWVNVIRKKTASSTTTTSGGTGTYTCEVVKPDSGANITYIPDKTEIECRVKIYLDGKDVTEKLNWTGEGYPYYFYSVWHLSPDAAWDGFDCYNPFPYSCSCDDISNGAVGSSHYVIPRTSQWPPDAYQSKIKFEFKEAVPLEANKICECTSGEVTFTLQK
jgi:hypothetical protein